jgi:hypothetical protein
MTPSTVDGHDCRRRAAGGRSSAAVGTCRSIRIGEPALVSDTACRAARAPPPNMRSPVAPDDPTSRLRRRAPCGEGTRQSPREAITRSDNGPLGRRRPKCGTARAYPSASIASASARVTCQGIPILR